MKGERSSEPGDFPALHCLSDNLTSEEKTLIYEDVRVRANQESETLENFWTKTGSHMVEDCD